MRKRWKRAIAVMMFAAVMVSGCGSNTAKKSSAEEPVHITFGHGQAEGHPYHIAALQFKKEVEKKTDHRVIVDVQPNGNLGDEREMTEGLQLGTIDITVAVAATLSGFDSDLDVFNFPYLFDSREEAFKVLDGKTGQKIFKGLEKQGIETYGTFDLGFRSMSYCPLAQAGTLKRGLMTHPVLVGLAEKYNATVEQIMLAWNIRDGYTIAIPRSGKAEHTLQNAGADLITLSEEDYQAIDRAFPKPVRKEYLDMQ